MDNPRQSSNFIISKECDCRLSVLKLLDLTVEIINKLKHDTYLSYAINLLPLVNNLLKNIKKDHDCDLLIRRSDVYNNLTMMRDQVTGNLGTKLRIFLENRPLDNSQIQDNESPPLTSTATAAFATQPTPPTISSSTSTEESHKKIILIYGHKWKNNILNVRCQFSDLSNGYKRFIYAHQTYPVLTEQYFVNFFSSKTCKVISRNKFIRAEKQYADFYHSLVKKHPSTNANSESKDTKMDDSFNVTRIVGYKWNALKKLSSLFLKCICSDSKLRERKFQTIYPRWTKLVEEFFTRYIERNKSSRHALKNFQKKFKYADSEVRLFYNNYILERIPKNASASLKRKQTLAKPCTHLEPEESFTQPKPNEPILPPKLKKPSMQPEPFVEFNQSIDSCIKSINFVEHPTKSKISKTSAPVTLLKIIDHKWRIGALYLSCRYSNSTTCLKQFQNVYPEYFDLVKDYFVNLIAGGRPKNNFVKKFIATDDVKVSRFYAIHLNKYVKEYMPSQAVEYLKTKPPLSFC